MTNIQFLELLPADVEEKMRKGCTAYESSHGIELNYTKFSFLLKDEADSVIAVLHGYTIFAEVYVEDLWVETAHRGKSYGRALLGALETHFQAKGFDNMNLVTSQFQAPEFYKKCGFTLEFVRKNRTNPKLNKYFFIKHFA